MESKKCILFKDLVAIEIERVCLLDWCISIFRVLESIIFDPKDVLNERKVSPGMVQHSLEIIVSVQEDHNAALLRSVKIGISSSWTWRLRLLICIACFIIHICQFLADHDPKPIILTQLQNWWTDSKCLE